MVAKRVMPNKTTSDKIRYSYNDNKKRGKGRKNVLKDRSVFCKEQYTIKDFKKKKGNDPKPRGAWQL